MTDSKYRMSEETRKAAYAAIAESDNEEIQTICDQCFRIDCWQGGYMCDAARGAGTVDITPQLIRLLEELYRSAWEESESWHDENTRKPTSSDAFDKELELYGLKRSKE